MAKNKKPKPTRKQIEGAITKIIESINMISQKLEYVENFTKSTDLALDLYTKFLKNHEEFKAYIEEYNKEQEKKIAKKEEQT